MGVSSCTGPSGNEGVAGYIAGWGGGMLGEPDGSSTFTIDVELVSPGGTLGGEEYKHSA